jgi:hypothetical protein
MDWITFGQTVAAFCIALVGWLAAHYFSSRRDLANDRRKLRISYLLEAYRKLEGASNRGDTAADWAQFESAIADIQLLGSAKQVSLARHFAFTVAKERTASLDDLIFDLRQSLRSELELEPVSEHVFFFRYYSNTSKSLGSTHERQME